MKKEIFKEYAERISSAFEIDKEMMFTKTKKRDVVDARFLLYYMCKDRPMKLIYIQEYMCSMGYEITHSTILYGISQVTKRMQLDSDYRKIVKTISKNVNP
jgi:chromosomal replication initiation ATPase DnaA